MKRVLGFLLILIVLLTGCHGENDVDRALSLRQKLLTGNGCSFDATVTADYQDKLFTFTMQCVAQKDGTLEFTVTQPETISGISGQISGEEGQLHFDDQVLVFDLMADGFVSPVSTPWLLLQTLRGGYIAAGGKDGDLYLFEIDDSYEQNPLRLDIWLNQENIPVAADIIWSGKRVVSLTVDNFRLL